ncbi:MAG: hypothetical protein J1F17_01695 [Oscillospiraceae bacterium]|nr:hypothetical protein [Oscillospiraceae bacterium]
MRESFIFYRSFFESLTDMNKEAQADCLMALADYALNGNEPVMTPEVKLFFTLIKPQVDANNKRYENGCKGAEFGKLGGRPKKPQTEENKTPKKPLKNPNQTPNDNVNDNVYLKEKINKKENLSFVSSEISKVASLHNLNKMEASVFVTTDFTIDFDNDEFFKPYACADPKLRQDVTNWMIKNKLNQRITKNFIQRQISTFAKRQGKLENLLTTHKQQI